jgi:hypothetical protein
LLPLAAIETISVEGIESPYLTISFQRQIAADDLSYTIEFSSDLVTWTPGGVLVSQTPSGNGDGLVREVWRATMPRSAGSQPYSRLRVRN